MPPENASIETRLAEVEDELRRLRQIVTQQEPANVAPWWKKIIGSHENDPVFAEIIELGRQIRAGERAAPKSKKKRVVKSPRSRSASRE